MKILFLTSTLPRFTGDQQAPFVQEQAAAWKRARHGDTVIILAPHDVTAARTETINEVEIHRFRYIWPASLQTLAYPAILPNLRANKWRALQIPFFLIASFFAARRLIQRNGIDLVYAHWVMPQGIVAYMLHKFCGVRYVLQNHSSDLTVFTKFGRFGRGMAARVLRQADAFFCVNQTQAAQAQGFLDGCMPYVLPMGLSLDVDKVVSANRPAECTYVLGTISRLSRKKGLSHLIAAVDAVAKEQMLGTIAIAGDGEDRETLTALPQIANIVFPGFLAGDAKTRFFSDCFAMVFSSVTSGGDVEGLPVALLEALATGKPVIVSEDTNITQLQEWPQIKEYVTFLPDPTDTTAFGHAIHNIVKLPPDAVFTRAAILRDIMGRYRWERLIEEYLDVIDNRAVQSTTAASGMFGNGTTSLGNDTIRNCASTRRTAKGVRSCGHVINKKKTEE